MERRRSAQVITKEQQDRIQKRESDLFLKKTTLITAKEEQLQTKDIKEIGVDLYKGKAESKLLVETKAIESKKREKFDPKKDASRDALTMGGRLPTMAGAIPTIRAMPSWRQGI